MKEIKIRFTDAMYECLLQQARADCRQISNSTGVPSFVRKSARALLSQNGFPVKILDMDDEEYAKHVKIEGQTVPDARKRKKTKVSGEKSA